jgi:tetratricopeptide (TPR) repeat protein
MYPPLPLSPSILPTPAPDSRRLDSIGTRSLAILDKDLYKPAARAIEGERKTQDGAAWNRSGNRLAQLHARYGHDSEAVAVLSTITAKDPSYVPALLNLAGLAQKAGRRDESLAWLRRAASMAPGSTVVSGYAKAIGYGEAMGFGPAIVDAPRTKTAGSDGASAPTDRAAGPVAYGWAGD